MPKMALLLLLGLFSIGFWAGCTDIDKDQSAPKGEFKELPLSEYKDTVTLDMYEGSRLSWVLNTRHLVKWPRTDMVKCRPVDLVVYDTTGAQVVRVTSDSGYVDEAISYLAATGNVHALSAKGVDIRTDSLRWNKTLNQINTEARVRVVSEDGDVLTGRGFTSDAKLDNWQILADVKGVFQKVNERFQEADKDTAAQGGVPGPDSAAGRDTSASKAPGPDAPAPSASAPGSPASPSAPSTQPAVPAPVPQGNGP